MESVEVKRLLSLVLDILKMMTEAGAEIYRVEESAVRIFRAYGIKQVDVYATTSNIIISLESAEGELFADMRRVGPISTDLEKIDKLNSLVRATTENRPVLDEISEEVNKIKEIKTYSRFLTIFSYGMIACVFYLFFGGRSTAEFLVSSLCGIVTGLLVSLIDRIGANKFLSKFICSFATCIISFTLLRLKLICGVDYIIIGNIMTLIPGIGLTNALRDLFTGDSISGVLRLIEAALLAIAIAAGYVVTTMIFGGAL